MTGFQTRPAQRTDLAQVQAVEEACYSLPWSEGSFEALFERSYVLFRVLQAEAPEGEGAASPVVGFGVLWWGGGEAELANLAVHPAWRQGGGGALLLDTLLAEAALRGVERVFLEVRVSNEPAQKLYMGRGFVPVGRRSRYYQKPVEDALVLMLDLSSTPS